MALQLDATEWEWNAQRLDAADLVAEGRSSFPAIAGKLGIDRVTLWHWRQHPAFRARVIGILQAAAETLADERVAHKVLRVKDLAQLIREIEQIREERTEAYAAYSIPGVSTGWLIPVPQARGGTAWQVDVALMAEYRTLTQTVVKELGQLQDKVDYTVKAQAAPVDYSQLTTEELQFLDRIARRLNGEAAPRAALKR